MKQMYLFAIDPYLSFTNKYARSSLTVNERRDIYYQIPLPHWGIMPPPPAHTHTHNVAAGRKYRESSLL